MEVTTSNYLSIYKSIPEAIKPKVVEEFHKLLAASSSNFKNWEHAKTVLSASNYTAWVKDRKEGFAIIAELAKDTQSAPSQSNEDDELELADAEAEALKLKLKLLKI